MIVSAITFCVSIIEAVGQEERHHRPFIPAGAVVAVRTDTQIAVGTAEPGDIFPATLDEDIVRGEHVVVRRGAPVEIRLTKVQEDRDELAFKLYTITFEGKKFRVVSDTAREAARREAPREQPGLGQAMGQAGVAALEGALGGRGGMSWSGADRREAKVPAGTTMEFTLREQVDLER
jgi:hypothetical protein